MCVLPSVRSRSRSEVLAQIYESLGSGWAIRTASRSHRSPIAHSSAKIGRKVLGRELATIADYRQRLNQYRTDVSLRAAHEAGPWITVW